VKSLILQSSRVPLREGDFPLNRALPANRSDSKPAPDKRFPYLEFIGKLNYLARSTRPDLFFVASHLATFCSYYQKGHWEACLDVMRYIKGTIAAGITYTEHAPPEPVGYSYANYATDPGDRKSVSGFCFEYAGGLISWKSKKKPIVAHSSSESELVALDSASSGSYLDRITLRAAQASRQAVRAHLGRQPWNDNHHQEPCEPSGYQHIDVRYFAVRDWIQEGKLDVQYLETSDMLADAVRGVEKMKLED
jgi:hypothetical protein